MTSRLAYAASTLDKTQATLTVRQFLNDKPMSVPRSDWEYVDEQTIRLLPAGTPLAQGYIYEFAYIAKDPLVPKQAHNQSAEAQFAPIEFEA